MKRIITLAVMMVVAMGICAPVNAGVTDKGLVKAYCLKHYKKAPRYVKQGSQMVYKHKGKMIVEVVKSKSKGKYGITRDGYTVRYNKRVKKGKKVTSYLIYSPKSNAVDDVVAVVDNRKVR